MTYKLHSCSFNWCVWWAFNNDVLFSELVHIDDGVKCPDSGFMDLSTARECSDAVGYAKSFNSHASYEGEGCWVTKPSGCSIHDAGDINFNNCSDGYWPSYYRTICKKGNRSFRIHILNNIHTLRIKVKDINQYWNHIIRMRFWGNLRASCYWGCYWGWGPV